MISCAGCGWPASPRSDTPFRCPRSGRPGDDVDHVLVRRLPAGARWPAGGERNPFLRYRTLLSAYDRAVDDSQLVDVIERLDDAVAARRRPRLRHHSVRPQRRSRRLGERRDGNTGRLPQGTSPHGRRDLARGRRDRAVARARHRELRQRRAVRRGHRTRVSNRPLRVFVPTWADDSVIARLRELDAQIEVCPRGDDDPPGDPCVLRLPRGRSRGRDPVLLPRSRQRPHCRRRAHTRLRARRCARSAGPPRRAGRRRRARVERRARVDRRGRASAPSHRCRPSTSCKPRCTRRWCGRGNAVVPMLDTTAAT